MNKAVLSKADQTSAHRKYKAKHGGESDRVIHLVPYDGVGGVESAARTMKDAKPEEFTFSVEYIYPNTSTRPSPFTEYSPFPLFLTAWRIGQQKPSILIVSLWRSYIVGIICKLLMPRTKLVLFLHLARDQHLADKIATRVAARLACEIWADSDQTLQQRFPGSRGKTISFVTNSIQRKHIPRNLPNFIFWGRLNPQKRLERAIEIFDAVRKEEHSAHFTIIGPDGGKLSQIKQQILSLNLSDAVTFTGPLAFREIAKLARRASYYLQTSETEGMAMSVVEAMQLGLVPVVTPVGEIRSYCRHDENSIVVQDNNQAAKDLISVLEDTVRYKRLQSAALSTWQDKELYVDSVLSACSELLTVNSRRSRN